MLQAHNEKVDRFTRRFSQDDLLLAELSNLPMFQTEEEQVLPAGAAGSLDKDHVRQLDQIRQDEERLEYLQANMSQLSDSEKKQLRFLQNLQEDRFKKRMIDSQKDKVEDVLTKLEYRLALVGKHNLDYATLYHDRNGGYDMEKLTEVLKQMKEDREQRGMSLESLMAKPQDRNGLVAGELEKKLTELMLDRIKKK